MGESHLFRDGSSLQDGHAEYSLKGLTWNINVLSLTCIKTLTLSEAYHKCKHIAYTFWYLWGFYKDIYKLQNNNKKNLNCCTYFVLDPPVFFYNWLYFKYGFTDNFGLIFAYRLTCFCVNLTKAISKVMLSSKPEQSLTSTTHRKYSSSVFFLCYISSSFFFKKSPSPLSRCEMRSMAFTKLLGLSCRGKKVRNKISYCILIALLDFQITFKNGTSVYFKDSNFPH